MAYGKDYYKGFNRFETRNTSRYKYGGMPPKRSGFKHKKTKYGSVYTGWKYSRKDGGIISIYITPYKKTKTKTSKTGVKWQNWFARLTMPNGLEIKTSALVNMDNHKVYLKDKNMIGNPNAPRGGYFGKHISRKYNN